MQFDAVCSVCGKFIGQLANCVSVFGTDDTYIQMSMQNNKHIVLSLQVSNKVFESKEDVNINLKGSNILIEHNGHTEVFNNPPAIEIYKHLVGLFEFHQFALSSVKFELSQIPNVQIENTNPYIFTVTRDGKMLMSINVNRNEAFETLSCTCVVHLQTDEMRICRTVDDLKKLLQNLSIIPITKIHNALIWHALDKLSLLMEQQVK